jgi:hypothetical protein
MKSRTGPEMTRAYEKLYNYLVARGLKPKLQKLDNEASQELQDFMQDKGVKFQFVPPHVHRRNAAERAIRTFKNHFIAGLCSTDNGTKLLLILFGELHFFPITPQRCFKLLFCSLGILHFSQTLPNLFWSGLLCLALPSPMQSVASTH